MAIRATASADSVILAIKRPGDVIIGRACGASWVELVGETGYARRTAADTIRALVGEDDQAWCTIADTVRFAGLGAPAVDTARLEQIGPGGAESAVRSAAPEVAVRIPPPPPPPAQTHLHCPAGHPLGSAESADRSSASEVAAQIPPPPTPPPAQTHLHCPAGHALGSAESADRSSAPEVAAQIPPPPTPTPASLPGSAAIRLHCPAGHRLVRFSASPCAIDQCGYGCVRKARSSTGRCGQMAKAPPSCRFTPPSPDLGGDDATPRLRRRVPLHNPPAMSQPAAPPGCGRHPGEGDECREGVGACPGLTGLLIEDSFVQNSTYCQFGPCLGLAVGACRRCRRSVCVNHGGAPWLCIACSSVGWFTC